jgi:hypothetical protein
MPEGNRLQSTAIGMARLEVAPPRRGRFSRHGFAVSPCAFLALGGRVNFFQSLENARKIFPIIGKNGVIFPTIGKIFSNHWKNAKTFFQSLENRRKIFPIVGKLSGGAA